MREDFGNCDEHIEMHNYLQNFITMGKEFVYFHLANMKESIVDRTDALLFFGKYQARYAACFSNKPLQLKRRRKTNKRREKCYNYRKDFGKGKYVSNNAPIISVYWGNKPKMLNLSVGYL